ncbi:uncharacterized protein LOC144603433 [Rhinoraja longicauda]
MNFRLEDQSTVTIGTTCWNIHQNPNIEELVASCWGSTSGAPTVGACRLGAGGPCQEPVDLTSRELMVPWLGTDFGSSKPQEVRPPRSWELRSPRRGGPAAGALIAPTDLTAGE